MPRLMLTLSPRLSQRPSLKPSQKPIQELRSTLELMPTPMLMPTLSLRLMPKLRASGAGSLVVRKDAIPVPLQRLDLLNSDKWP